MVAQAAGVDYERMIAGEFINIEPNMKHWVLAENESTLLLIK